MYSDSSTSGSLCQVVAYALQSPGLPFPMFIICFAINGFGLAVQVSRSQSFSIHLSSSHPYDKDAQANGYVASLKDNAETKMGILHAAYGVLRIFKRSPL